MIDEDLYQQATDELNSDKRRPHIWARACALASDDHDEARYLYTNLRVEELIEERERTTGGLRPAAEASPAPMQQQDASLALEPLGLDDEIPESISTPSGVDQNSARDEILTLNSEMQKNNELIDSLERKSFEEKFDSSKDDSGAIDERDDSAFSDEYLDETINLTSELDGTAVFELDNGDASEFDSQDHHEELAENESGTVPVSEEDDELEALLGGIYLGSPPPPPSDPLADDASDAALTLDFSDVTGSHGELSTEEDNRELQQFPPQGPTDRSFNETERQARELTQELERQADELPGQRSDIVAVNNGSGADESLESAEYENVSGDSFDEEAERNMAESLQRDTDNENRTSHDDEPDESPGQHDLESDREVPTRHTAGISELPAAAMAAAGVAAARPATDRSEREFPVDLSEQHSGTRYSVFLRGNQAQAVKAGGSWSALILTLPYLVYRHLFGTALVYMAMWLIVLAGLLVSGLAWLDAGTAANVVLKYTTVGFALLAVIGLLYLPFRYCNQWREDKLEQRGFERIAWVRAASPGQAISAARQAAALDQVFRK